MPLPTIYTPLVTTRVDTEAETGVEELTMEIEDKNSLTKRRNKNKPIQTRSTPQRPQKEGDVELLTLSPTVSPARVVPSHPEKDTCPPSKV